MGWYGKYILLNTPIPKITNQALPWTDELKSLKLSVKNSRKHTNSCLLNLYHDCAEGMGLHSDGGKSEKEWFIWHQ